jgi:hypothetical protein
LAVVIHSGLAWVRGWFVRWIREFALGGWFAWIESGGVVVAASLLPFMPVLIAVTALAMAAAVGALHLGAAGAERVWDARQRVGCPSCQRRIRAEACVCAGCGAEVAPKVVLASPA